jgi:hypothetical protein
MNIRTASHKCIFKQYLVLYNTCCIFSNMLYVKCYFSYIVMPVPDDDFMNKPKHVARFGK